MVKLINMHDGMDALSSVKAGRYKPRMRWQTVVDWSINRNEFTTKLRLILDERWIINDDKLYLGLIRQF